MKIANKPSLDVVAKRGEKAVVGQASRKPPLATARERPPKFAAVKSSRGRYQVLEPALRPRHVTAEDLEAAVLALVR
jgi:hypothetical protein